MIDFHTAVTRLLDLPAIAATAVLLRNSVNRQRGESHSSGIAHFNAPADPPFIETVFQVFDNRTGKIDRGLRGSEFMTAIIVERLAVDSIVEKEARH
jgi:hypothetical protein